MQHQEVETSHRSDSDFIVVIVVMQLAESPTLNGGDGDACCHGYHAKNRHPI